MNTPTAIQRFLNNILGVDEDGGAIRSSALLLGVRVVSIAATVATSLLYARALGSQGYGLFAYVTAFSTVIAVISSLGFPQYLLRQGAITKHPLKNILDWADRRLFIVGILASIVMVIVGLTPLSGNAGLLFVIASPLPLITNLTAVRQSLLQIKGDFATSQWPKMVLVPAIMVAGLGLFWQAQNYVTPYQLVALAVASATVPLFMAERRLQTSARAAGKNKFDDLGLSVKAAFPFACASCLYFVNSRVDLLMLGATQDSSVTGMYAVAAKAAELVSLFLVTGIAVIAPRVAKYHHSGDHTALQRLIRRTSLWVAALSSPVALIFILSPEPFLTLLYGQEFSAASGPLRILAIGQLFNSLSGPAGILLNMTGHEKLSTFGVGISLVVNVILNALLIPRYGATGAAIATTVSVILWNVLLIYWAKKKLRVQTSILGI